MCHSVTMKIHDIESHLPALKYEFGQLGQFVEENSERDHHLRNRLAQAYSHISDPEKRANAEQQERNLCEHPETEGRISSMRAGFKRTYSGDIIAKRSLNKQQKDDAERERVKKVLARMYSAVTMPA